MIYYRVHVSTGDKGLDPEAKAFVILYSDSGETGEVQLERRDQLTFTSGR